MNSLSRIFLIAVVAVSLIVAPLNAAAKPFGIVVQAEHARLGKAQASEGATVFEGDLLATDSSGTLRVRTTSGQVYLLQESLAELTATPDGAAIRLSRGTVGWKSDKAGLAGVYVLGALVRPKSEAAHVQISISKPNELTVASAEGAAEIVLLNRTIEVPAGKAYRVEVEPAAAQGGAGAGAGISSNAVAVWVMVAAVLGGIILSTIMLEQSDSRPSPFRP
ncbi:MAG TPA: hypothetical protein VNL38_03760 [Candidatus Nitrosotenuis sp.]|nr:hypothetical protein [Candidatus Nitrosotenuis sp.]